MMFKYTTVVYLCLFYNLANFYTMIKSSIILFYDFLTFVFYKPPLPP